MNYKYLYIYLCLHNIIFFPSRDCLKKTVKNEGARGLFRGVAISIALVTPEQAIKFTTYDFIKDICANRKCVIYFNSYFLLIFFLRLVFNDVIP